MLWIACIIPRRYLTPFHQPLPPTVRQHTAETARQAAERIAQWALQFTPCVTITGWAHAVLMEAQASLRLWGGQERLVYQVIHGSQGLGWHGPDALTIACGPTARAALWQALGWQEQGWHYTADLQASSFDATRLDALPLTVIEELHCHLDILARMGVHTIGQFKKLPRPGITRRFGMSVLDALDAAEGRRNESHAWIQQPAEFHIQRELPARADHVDMIVQAVLPCLHALSAWLLARQSAVTAIDLQLLHDGPPHSLLELRCAGPTRDTQRLLRILTERLTRFRLPRPVYDVALHVADVIALPHQTKDFLGGSHEAEQALQELIERLQARLGTDNVCRLCIEDEHRPEKAVYYSAMEPAALPGPRHRPRSETDQQPIGQTPHRPTWLLNQPLPLGIQHHRPVYHGPLQLLCGPERIEAGWWEDCAQQQVQRDYFIARSLHDELLWVFRTPAHQWYLHGFFS